MGFCWRKCSSRNTAMYIESYRSDGCTYYMVRENESVNGERHHRFVVALGIHPTLREAFEHFERAYFEAKKAKKWEPFSPKERKAWEKLFKIWVLLDREQPGGYRADARFDRENMRWVRWREQQERDRRNPRARWLRLLGLRRGCAPEEIRAARDRKARECHPDHGGTDEAMAAVNEAYERLMEAS